MRLMIVGSLEGHISEAGKIALSRGADVVHCEDEEEALGALRSGKGADLVMIDVRRNIASFIKSLEEERIAVQVVACGLENDAAAAVRAIKAGAKEYVPLPPDAELIAAVLQAAVEERSEMIAGDPAMRPVMEMAAKIAPSDATVLITGASGTGKEVMSRYIHNHSRRKDGKFISLNCAAIPENLLESELFGHEKGAFTGAVARRIGKFEEAGGGTLLLDEISEMHPALQAKLLRAVQERVIDRVGGREPVKIDIRLIATSNRDLQEEVKKGNFREDLYFRLNVVNLDLPGLKDRPADILPLAEMFAEKYAKDNGLPLKKISKAATEKLKNYHWPGNVRELENTLHRAVLISAENEIEEAAIILSEAPKPAAQKPPSPPSADDGADSAIAALVGSSVAEMEQELITRTLDHCLGNRTHAARILGISIRTLRNKLSQYEKEQKTAAK
ncbi:MAG: sigma-54-dependent Fis family transcriptional regulator [Micavibrio sp.]|nr:MAG: sigma-54-dependent Fis family transcriptional regulator [Micavibrio sp.]